MPRLASYVLAFLTVAAAGCIRSEPAPRVWAADDMVHLTEHTPPAASEVWDAGHRTVRLFAAGNETVSFQLVIEAADKPVGGITVSMAEPATPDGRKLGPASVTIFRMLPVEVRRFPAWYLRLADQDVAPGQFYDALCPLEAPKVGQPFHVPAGQRVALWIDVAVPRDARSGEYAAGLTVSYPLGRVHTEVKLTVYDFVLPDARPVVCAGGFDHETVFRHFVRRADNEGRVRPFVPERLSTDTPEVAAGLSVIRQLMVLAHRHRLDLFDKALHPIIKRDREGKIGLLWEDYDLIARPYLDGTAFEDRVGVSLWPAPVGSDWPRAEDYGGIDSEDYQRTYAELAKLAGEHLAELEAGKRSFFWPRPGQIGSAGYRRQAELARLIRQGRPDSTILSELPPEAPPESNWLVPADLSEVTDIWAVPGNLAALSWADKLTRPEKPLSGLWVRPGRPPYVGSCGVLGSPADIRALPWLAMKYRCAGLFLPETLNWSDPSAPPEGDGEPEGMWTFDPASAAEGSEDRLFYPGTAFGVPGVLPSVRLKRLRRGLQDVAYLDLLHQRQRAAVAEALVSTMVRYGALDAAGDHYLDPRLDGWVRDGALWIAARRLLAEEVADAVHPGSAATNLAATRLTWKKLSAATTTVRVEQVRTIVDPFEKGYRARIRVELFNELGRAVDVAVALGQAPPGWVDARGPQRIEAFPPHGRRTVEIVLTGDQVPTSSDARMPIPLTIALDGQEARTILAEAPFLLVGFTGKAVAIDGNPDDWPLRPANTAARFRLLGRRGQVGDGLARRQTHAFALRDEANLYLLIRCAEPDAAAVTARADNTVRYEQLVACGEDLVEVILDPGRSAKGVEDLYHVVVKANGVVVTERGVSSDPPLGISRPWLANVRSAVGRREGLWMVELAIPLASFGPEGRKPFWGANFTRFATVGGEASSWSGAPRYFYHPDNLGTIYLLGEGDRPRFTRLLVTDPLGGGVIHW